MEDWKQKLANTTQEYTLGSTPKARTRRQELRTWREERHLTTWSTLSDPAHVVELMELIDRWHDEDAANKPCAPPAPEQPANPFIEVTVRQTIRVGTFGTLKVKAFNHEFVNLELEWRKYRPTELRTLAKQLSDLADAHEDVYSPDPHLDDL